MHSEFVQTPLDYWIIFMYVVAA